MNFTFLSFNRISETLISTSLIFLSQFAFSEGGLAEGCPGKSARQTTVVDFICSPDGNPNSVETLFIESNRCRIPLVRSTSVPFERCQAVAKRFQQAYNCRILDTLTTDFVTTKKGEKHPAIFAVVKPRQENQLATLDLCPALKPQVKNGKLLILMFESGRDINELKEKLDNLRLSITDISL